MTETEFEKMYDVLTEKLDKEGIDKFIEQIGKIEIVEKKCPGMFGLSEVENCGTCPQNCPKCWTEAMGTKEGRAWITKRYLMYGLRKEEETKHGL
jgi:hypothetical protein